MKSTVARENEVFHVRIERENDYSKIVTQNDISEIDLIERIVKPYNMSGSEYFYCGGSSIMKSEVRRIIIFKTNLPLSSLLLKINENNGQNSSSTVSKDIDDKWALIQQKGEDVTSRFIKYPVNPWRDKMQICLNGQRPTRDNK